MVYSTSLTLPAQLVAEDELPVDEILRDLSNAAPILTCQGQKEVPTKPPAALASAYLVYVRKGSQLQPLAQPYSSPYKVLERGPKYFRLDIGGKNTAVTVDRMKPHTGTTETTPAAPPRHGRPARQRPASPAMTMAPTTPTSPPPRDVNGTDNPCPGTISRTSSHYRSSPCTPRRAPNRLDL
jgi:hypothetical protein